MREPETSRQSAHTSPCAPRPHPVFWVIAVALVVLATVEFLRWSGPIVPAAHAQPVTSGGSRGVFAFAGQLSRNEHGVFMVDVDTMTIWVYEYLPQRGCMRLAAARTWRYDRYLENHNTCGELSPEAVELLIENQRLDKRQRQESESP